MTYLFFALKKSTFYILVNHISNCFKNELNNKLDGCEFEIKEDGAYVKYTLPGGADPVLKKLGEIEFMQLHYTDRYAQTTTGSLSIPLSKGDYMIATAKIGSYDATQEGYVTVPIVRNSSSVCSVSSGTVNKQSNNLYRCSLKQDGTITINFDGDSTQARCAAIIIAFVFKL